MLRGAFACCRCIVPADLFYEWKAEPGGKQPFAIGREDGFPLTFDGLWEGWNGAGGTILQTYAIITTAANDDMAHLHRRIPLIVEETDWPVWLGEVDGDPAASLAPPRAVLV